MKKTSQLWCLVLGSLLISAIIGYASFKGTRSSGGMDPEAYVLPEGIVLVITKSDQGAARDEIFNVKLKDKDSEKVIYGAGESVEPQFFFSDQIIHEDGYLLVDEIVDGNTHRKWIYLLSQSDNIVRAVIKHIGGESVSISSYIQYTASNRCKGEYPSTAPFFFTESQVKGLIGEGCLDMLSITNGEYHLTFDGLSTISYSEMDNHWIWEAVEACGEECDYLGGIVE